MTILIERPWVFYIIENNGATYMGISPDPVHRLRAHNSEIMGGAKYTKSKGSGWKHVLIVHGFKDKIHTMQFEWACKHFGSKGAGGVVNRVIKMIGVMNKERCTTKACESSVYPLEITLHGVNYELDKKIMIALQELPFYVSIKNINKGDDIKD
jgi:predicted GIY-YIG superfamily endonuclease